MMTARWYYRNPAGDFVEIIDRIARVGWEVSEHAEQGEAGMSTIVIDDPGMDFDFVGHVGIYCIEDSSEADDDVLFGGNGADQEIGRAGGEWEQPLGRIWTITVTDKNSDWQKRVMVGSDCDRPAETDVERVQWLMTTSETSWASDKTTYVSTAAPVDMDACDYRGQMLTQIVDDCSQASGKNWFTWFRRDGDGDLVNTVWYGRDTLAVYDSPLSLSNDSTDWTDAELADGTSLVWPISMDTKLRRDPSRVYSGVYLPYDGGAVYRQDAATAAEFGHWDFIAPSGNVKTSAKAIARAVRYLDELGEQDLVVTTSVELPAAKATMLRAGMRVLLRATHLPGFTGDYQWCRVLTCSITPIAAGERYRLTLELAPTGTGLPAGVLDWAYREYALDTPYDVVLDGPPRKDATMVAFCWARNTGWYPASISGGSWTLQDSGYGYDASQYGGPGSEAWLAIYTRVAGAGESATITVDPDAPFTAVGIAVVAGAVSGAAVKDTSTVNPGGTRTTTVTADEGDMLLVGWSMQRTTYADPDSVAAGANVTEIRDAEVISAPHSWVAYSTTVVAGEISVAGSPANNAELNKWGVVSIGLRIVPT